MNSADTDVIWSMQACGYSAGTARREPKRCYCVWWRCAIQQSTKTRS